MTLTTEQAQSVIDNGPNTENIRRNTSLAEYRRDIADYLTSHQYEVLVRDHALNRITDPEPFISNPYRRRTIPDLLRWMRQESRGPWAPVTVTDPLDLGGNTVPLGDTDYNLFTAIADGTRITASVGTLEMEVFRPILVSQIGRGETAHLNEISVDRALRDPGSWHTTIPAAFRQARDAGLVVRASTETTPTPETGAGERVHTVPPLDVNGTSIYPLDTAITDGARARMGDRAPNPHSHDHRVALLRYMDEHRGRLTPQLRAWGEQVTTWEETEESFPLGDTPALKVAAFLGGANNDGLLWLPEFAAWLVASVPQGDTPRPVLDVDGDPVQTLRGGAGVRHNLAPVAELFREWAREHNEPAEWARWITSPNHDGAWSIGDPEQLWANDYRSFFDWLRVPERRARIPMTGGPTVTATPTPAPAEAAVPQGDNWFDRMPPLIRDLDQNGNETTHGYHAPEQTIREYVASLPEEAWTYMQRYYRDWNGAGSYRDVTWDSFRADPHQSDPRMVGGFLHHLAREIDSGHQPHPHTTTTTLSEGAPMTINRDEFFALAPEVRFERYREDYTRWARTYHAAWSGTGDVRQVLTNVNAFRQTHGVPADNDRDTLLRRQHDLEVFILDVNAGRFPLTTAAPATPAPATPTPVFDVNMGIDTLVANRTELLLPIADLVREYGRENGVDASFVTYLITGEEEGGRWSRLSYERLYADRLLSWLQREPNRSRIPMTTVPQGDTAQPEQVIPIGPEHPGWQAFAERMAQVATQNNMCPEYDRIAAEMQLPTRKDEVTYRVTIDVPVTVPRGANADDRVLREAAAALIANRGSVNRNNRTETGRRQVVAAS